MPDVREQLRLVIKDRAYIQAEIALLADIAPGTLSAALNKRQRLDANAVCRLCSVLGMTFDEVMAYAPSTKEAPVCKMTDK